MSEFTREFAHASLDPLAKAREDVAEAAAEIAKRCVSEGDEGAESLKGRAEAINTAAEAVARMSFGQGGNYSYEYPNGGRSQQAGFR